MIVHVFFGDLETMAKKVIQIPTLNDEEADFRQLFDIWRRTNGLSKGVVFRFSHCDFLRPNAVAFLGGLARLIESRQRTVVFDFSTIPAESVVMTNLCQNGFAERFGQSPSSSSEHWIPYREDKHLDMNVIMDYLTLNWIGKGWVHVSDRLRDAIAGRVWEIYSNAFEHSDTGVGVYSCGQHYEEQNELVLSVADFGLGIPAKIRAFLGKYDSRALNLSADTCLRWAFARGNSTCTGDVPRGLGLDLLKEFIRLNQGKLEVYSNEGYAIIDKDGERFQNRSVSFEGTVVHIILRCDENLYRFKDEAESAS